MPLRMNQISRPSLVGREPVRKPKKKKRIHHEHIAAFDTHLALNHHRDAGLA